MAAILASSSRRPLSRCSSRLSLNLWREPCAPSQLHQPRYASTLFHSEEQSPSPVVNIRSKPWDFKSNSGDVTTGRQSQARFILQIISTAQKGRFADVLSIAADMKAAGFTPDISVYNALIMAADIEGLWLEAWAIFDDMLMLGVKPNILTFNHLLHAQRHRPSGYMWNVLEKMKEMGFVPNPSTYSIIIRRCVVEKNLEMALRYVYTAKSQGISVELHAVQGVIILAAKLGYPRLAIDLAMWYEQDSVRRLDHVAWMNCLISSAESFYPEGVQRCWKTVTEDFNLTPDEGLCSSVLNTASRHGLPELAQSVFVVLKLIGAEIQEHHFAAFIEACTRSGQITEAVSILASMRDEGVEASMSAKQAILKELTGDADAIDNVLNTLDDLHKGGRPVDISALQLIVEAAVSLDDLQRAVGTYKSFPEYGVSPNLATFNALLVGCINAGHRQLGDLLLADMKEAQIKPDKDTYQSMIFLSLTQETYEDVFFYLEEMKAANYVPPYGVYDAIVRKCMANDDPRYKIAVEEMAECGYQPPSYIKTVQREKVDPALAALQAPGVVLIDEAAQRFIETGGLPTSDEQGHEAS